MAKDSSFDVVSQIDMQEVDNAYGQAKKEISQRYDLKDSGSDISLVPSWYIRLLNLGYYGFSTKRFCVQASNRCFNLKTNQTRY